MRQGPKYVNRENPDVITTRKQFSTEETETMCGMKGQENDELRRKGTLLK